MKKICFSIIIALLLFSLIGCNSNTDKIILKNGSYVMEYKKTESVLIPSIRISDNEILFSYDMLSSYLTLGTYTIDGHILTMTTNDDKYIYVFQIAGDNLIFQENESSLISLIDNRLGVKVTDKAKFHLVND